jgi:hypothetical protein
MVQLTPEQRTFVIKTFYETNSHDITILLQACVINLDLVTFLLYHDCIRLVRTTL